MPKFCKLGLTERKSMKRIKSLLVITLIAIGQLYAQDPQLFKLWPDSILTKANSAAQSSFMSEQEKLVVYYTNLVRINPELFANTYLENYLEQNDLKKDKEIRMLVKELEATGKRAILKPSLSLTNVARAHAKDMGEVGKTGHNSSNGKSFRARMDEVSKIYSGINENCNYGNEKGVDIFMDLLIDRNVPNYGHRKNILDPEMKYIGVAIEPHKRYRVNCVQDFGGDKL